MVSKRATVRDLIDIQLTISILRTTQSRNRDRYELRNEVLVDVYESIYHNEPSPQELLEKRFRQSMQTALVNIIRERQTRLNVLAKLLDDRLDPSRCLVKVADSLTREVASLKSLQKFIFGR